MVPEGSGKPEKNGVIEGTLTFRTWGLPVSMAFPGERMPELSVPEQTGGSFYGDMLPPGTPAEERKDIACEITKDQAGAIASVYYTEIDETGGLTENTLEFLPEESFRLTRSGALSAKFDFLPGRKTLTDMVTPYGAVSLCLMTTETAIKKDPQGVLVMIRYHFIESSQEIHLVEYRIVIP